MALAYLTDPNNQFVTRNGVPAAYGFIRVFYDGTDDAALTYSNFDGAVNPDRIVLDNNGRAVIIATVDEAYRTEVYDRYGDLQWTCVNLKPIAPSVNNFTDADREKLDGIQSGAQKNVQSDWNQSDSTKDDFIKHKPAISNIVLSTPFGNENVGTMYVDLLECRIRMDDGNVRFLVAPTFETNPSKTMVLTANTYGIPEWKSNDEVAPQADWNEENSLSGAFIKNKPALPFKDADLELHDIVEMTLDEAGTHTILIEGSKEYDITVDGVSVTIDLTTAGNTVHSILKIGAGSTSDCSQVVIRYYDEALNVHEIRLDMNETNKFFFFDVYIRRIRRLLNNYFIARVSDFPCGYRQSPGTTTTYDNNTNWIGRWSE